MLRLNKVMPQAVVASTAPPDAPTGRRPSALRPRAVRQEVAPFA